MAASSSMMRIEPGPAETSVGRRVSTAAFDIRFSCYKTFLNAHGLADHGEFQMERGACAGRALHVDLASVFLDDAVAHGEAESGAAAFAYAACILRGKEWLVDAAQIFRLDAGATIA